MQILRLSLQCPLVIVKLKLSSQWWILEVVRLICLSQRVEWNESLIIYSSYLLYTCYYWQIKNFIALADEAFLRIIGRVNEKSLRTL